MRHNHVKRRPPGSIKAVEDLIGMEGRILYWAIPHMGYIKKVVWLQESGFFRNLSGYRSMHSCRNMNIGERNNNNSNFVFTNFWIAAAYVIRCGKVIYNEETSMAKIVKEIQQPVR